MAQLILIDHSLSGPGSHHYEYAVHLLAAADRLGLQTVLASNRRFRRPVGLPLHCRLLPLFYYSTYSGNSLAKPNDRRPRGRRHQRWQIDDWWLRMRHWRRARRHCRRLESFRSACQSLLEHVPLRDGDHVFLPTVSEFDLLGLGQLLRRDPATRAAHWHLQFHFNFLEGRPPDYARQESQIAEMRRRFEAGIAGLSQHRLHFYSTTPEMVDQYNRLGVARFECLPYPVNPALRTQRPPADEPRRLRVVCAGGERDEKGSRLLSGVVADLWPDLLSSGRIQLLVQGQASRLQRLLQRPVTQGTLAELASGEIPAGEIVQFPFPLPLSSYASLLRRADIGLFLYDSWRYYARCSGVLVEMLCCGTPVIVPAGCWMAEQIAVPNQHYLASLGSTAQQTFALKCRGSAAGAMRVPVPTDAVLARIDFGQAQAVEGTHVLWQVQQLDRRGERVSVANHLLRCPPGEGQARFAVQLEPRTVKLVVSARNAFHDHQIVIREAGLGFAGPTSQPGQPRPISAIGLAFASQADVGSLLREIVRHYDHYRACSCDFARGYRQQHEPVRTIEQLLARGAPAEKTAA